MKYTSKDFIKLTEGILSCLNYLAPIDIVSFCIGAAVSVLSLSDTMDINAMSHPLPDKDIKIASQHFLLGFQGKLFLTQHGNFLNVTL